MKAGLKGPTKQGDVRGGKRDNRLKLISGDVCYVPCLLFTAVNGLFFTFFHSK